MSGVGLGKCASCLDRAITSGKPVTLATVPDAVVLVTVLQQFGQVTAPGLTGVCLACRQQQLGTVSRAGLVTA